MLRLKISRGIFGSHGPKLIAYNYKDSYYLPDSVLVEENVTNWDVYENNVLVDFIYTVWLKSKDIFTRLKKDYSEQNRIVSDLQGNIGNGYHTSIITVKKIYVAYLQNMIIRFDAIEEALYEYLIQYQSLFGIPQKILEAIPRNTKTFQQIIPYRKIYYIVHKWFEFGEYDIKRENLVMEVKTLDKLFEYFCYFKLLNVFNEHGFEITDNGVSKFHYNVPDCYYKNEKEIANTILLNKDDLQVTIYYQPVIYANKFENGITMYRRNSQRGYYTPDFLIKFVKNQKEPEYAVFDAKFSNRSNIKRFRLDEVVFKYGSECAVGLDPNRPAPPAKMVWIFQGRVDQSDIPVVEDTDQSPLARRYRPLTSKGIISTNTRDDFSIYFWQSIERQLECFD